MTDIIGGDAGKGKTDKQKQLVIPLRWLLRQGDQQQRDAIEISRLLEIHRQRVAHLAKSLFMVFDA